MTSLIAQYDILPFYFLPLHHRAAGRTENQGDDVTNRLKDHFYCLVHNRLFLNDE